jgi:acetylglutamate synthase
MKTGYNIRIALHSTITSLIDKQRILLKYLLKKHSNWSAEDRSLFTKELLLFQFKKSSTLPLAFSNKGYMES